MSGSKKKRRKIVRKIGVNGLHGEETHTKKGYTKKRFYREGTTWEGDYVERGHTRRTDYMGRITRGGDAHMLYCVSLRKFFTENVFFICSGLLRGTIRQEQS